MDVRNSQHGTGPATVSARTSAGARFLAALIFAAGVASAVAGCLPYELMQEAGALIRRASDFTPERYRRYLQVCWFFAIALSATGVWIWRRRSIPLPPTSADHTRHRGEWKAIAGIVIVAALLRGHRYDTPMAYDEAYTYVNFASRPWYEAIGDYNSTNNHLLNTLLMHVAARLAGPQEWALRWHVFLAGSLLPWAVFLWARDWLGRPAALIAAASVAVSPLLITYSVDARGYILVALAAVLLDWSLARLANRDDRRAWWTAYGALVAGLCAMPLMLYAATASLLWFLLSPPESGQRHRALQRRLARGALLAAFTTLTVAAFYTPAYIFRELMFLNDPIMRPAGPEQFAAALASAWRGAFEWWTDGPLPSWVWGALAAAGVLMFGNAWMRVRWSIPFAVVLAFNVVQHVAPPPRTYLHLTPWILLAAAWGALSIAQKLRLGLRTAAGTLALIVLAGGVLYSVTRPVLFDAAARRDYVSVPEVIGCVAEEVRRTPERPHVLLAPLPCDLPSIFYLRREGVEMDVNRRPLPGEQVWLIARAQETPADVLATPLLNMPDLDRLTDWERVAEYETLTLYAGTQRMPQR